MAAAKGFFDQYSVLCVFGSVVGCVIVPLITQVSRQSNRDYHCPPRTCLSLPISVFWKPHLLSCCHNSDGQPAEPTCPGQRATCESALLGVFRFAIVTLTHVVVQAHLKDPERGSRRTPETVHGTKKKRKGNLVTQQVCKPSRFALTQHPVGEGTGMLTLS